MNPQPPNRKNPLRITPLAPSSDHTNLTSGGRPPCEVVDELFMFLVLSGIGFFNMVFSDYGGCTGWMIRRVCIFLISFVEESSDFLTAVHEILTSYLRHSTDYRTSSFHDTKKLNVLCFSFRLAHK